MAEGGVGNGQGSIGTWLEETDPMPMYGSGHCKWFNVRMGFGFISMTSRRGNPIDPPMDVFVHQSKLHMEGFRSLREGEALEFTFNTSPRGLESVWVTGPGGVPCVGSERRPKGKNLQQRWRTKGDRCYNCGGLDHHAKECTLPPQPKKCHFCQSSAHMVAHCPHKTPPTPAVQGRLTSETQSSGSSTFSHQDRAKPSGSNTDTKTAPWHRKKRKK